MDLYPVESPDRGDVSWWQLSANAVSSRISILSRLDTVSRVSTRPSQRTLWIQSDWTISYWETNNNNCDIWKLNVFLMRRQHLVHPSYFYLRTEVLLHHHVCSSPHLFVSNYPSKDCVGDTFCVCDALIACAIVGGSVPLYAFVSLAKE